VIARGNFSFVYLAESEQKKFVAIKEYIPQGLLHKSGSSAQD
jgi:hypothetical protein